jgi:hypothetical protein
VKTEGIGGEREDDFTDNFIVSKFEWVFAIQKFPLQTSNSVGNNGCCCFALFW